MDSGMAMALDRKPTGQTRICTASTSSGFPATSARWMPIHSIANRNSRSSPTAPRKPAAPPWARQPSPAATARSTARPIADCSMSAADRPTRTAPLAMGIERKRSTTPLLRSWVTATIVPSRPKAMVSASMPGSR